jgi:tetratricopeptide (TPR) repeat protein
MPVSIEDEDLLAGYEVALGAFRSYVGDPVLAIDTALERSSDFVLGHLFRAIALYLVAERSFAASAGRSLIEAEARRSLANDRERRLMDAIRALVDGDWDRACDGLDGLLARYPRDALALQTAHLMDFFRGDALNLRNRIARVLPYWDHSTPGYSYVLGMHAFGLEECNQYPEAEAVARQALDYERKDAWAVHAATHVMEMQGRVREGIEFLESRRLDWAPDNGFAYHNWWHLALFYLDLDDAARVLALYDDEIATRTDDFAIGLVDESSLLWRLQLFGVDIGDRFERVADRWAAKGTQGDGWYAFNDMHALLAYAGAGRADAVDGIVDAVTHAAAAGEVSNRMMSEQVGVPVCRGMRDFANGNYAAALQTLSEVRDRAHRFGGSHAQRDVITLTLIEAAIRAGEGQVARHYINERRVAKPSSKLGERLAERLAARAG